MAGHSLGEYSALYAAGVFTFADALTLVKHRGEVMSQVENGAMAAILGVDAGVVEACLADNGLLALDIANYNAPSQTVISGPRPDIARAQAAFAAAGAVFLPLNTAGAFHSRHMAPAQAAFEQFIRGITFRVPQTPVISNVRAEPYPPSDIADLLISQITNPVRWSQTMSYLLDQGHRDFEELGPGDVLSKLVMKNLEHRAETVAFAASNAAPVSQAPQRTGRSGPGDDVARGAARQAVEAWNQRHDVGTRVRVHGFDGVLETRTEALVVLGCRAAIYMKRYKGYFPLDDVTPLL